MISLPFSTTRVEPIFGLTQIQSTPAGTGKVPLVSMAIVKPPACMAAIRARVELQQRFAAGEHHVFAGRIGGRPQAVDLGSEQRGVA